MINYSIMINQLRLILLKKIWNLNWRWLVFYLKVSNKKIHIRCSTDPSLSSRAVIGCQEVELDGHSRRVLLGSRGRASTSQHSIGDGQIYHYVVNSKRLSYIINDQMPSLYYDKLITHRSFQAMVRKLPWWTQTSPQHTKKLQVSYGYSPFVSEEWWRFSWYKTS